ncbi:hypothetical protein LPB90_09315, partial [Chryseobacterium sp. LC2016-29]|nr:hypothetical protein [Chryseobacterium sp. LC2016-29]
AGGGIPPMGLNPCGDPFGGGCGGGGSGDDGYEYPEPPQEDPCIVASARNTTAKTILNNIKVNATKTTATQTIATDTVEKSFSIWKDENGEYQTTPIATGTTSNDGVNSTNMSITNPKTEAVAHTHVKTDYNCFSNIDIFNLQKGNLSRPSLSYSFAFGSDGSTYALTIINPTKFAAFVAQYPAISNFVVDAQGNIKSAGFKEGTELHAIFWTAHQQFLNQGFSDDDAFANATAHILNKYDTGATLSQQDSSGNFNSIFVNENIIPGVPGQTLPSTTFTKTADCNLQ